MARIATLLKVVQMGRPVIAFLLIEMQLLEGPFEQLSGEWRFEPLGENAAKVFLDLKFKFKSKLLDMSLSTIFTKIASSQLDAFVARANKIYG